MISGKRLLLIKSTVILAQTLVPTSSSRSARNVSLVPTSLLQLGADTIAPTPTTFSLCQGFSCNGPDGNLDCPDNRVQSREKTGSAGGNVFITIIEAKGYGDRDGEVLPDAGIAKWSDAYVRVKVGTDGHWSTKETDKVGRGKKASWSKTLAMGWHRAGEARIMLELLDYDTGLELLNGGDDSLGETSLWLPFCSMLAAGSPEDWPRQKLCQEEGWLLLNNGHYTAKATQACCETDAACLRVAIEIVPFQIYVDEVYVDDDYLLHEDSQMPYDISLFVDPAIRSAGDLPIAGFGQPYVDKETLKVNVETSLLTANGALLLQTQSQIYQPKDNYPPQYARLSINAFATLTLCRPANCHTLPTWLHEWEYVTSIQATNEDHYAGYACYQKDFGPTKRDQYGSPLGNSISLGWPWCKRNYFIVAEPHLGPGTRQHRQQNTFTPVAFVVGLIQFGVPLIILLSGGIWSTTIIPPNGTDNRAENMSFRLHSTLFFGDGASVKNREFRHNYFWASRASSLLRGLPSAILCVCAATFFVTVRPRNIGFFVLFMGTAVLALIRAISQWRQEWWRLTQNCFAIFVLSAGGVFSFLIFAIFNDSACTINFNALTMGSLTLNLVPLALEKMEFCSSIKLAKKAIALSLGVASKQVAMQSSDTGAYWLLKECYSASSNLSCFDYVPDIAGNFCGLTNQINTKEIALLRRSIFRAAAHLILVAYVVGAFIFTTRGYLALAILMFLTCTEVIVSFLDYGRVQWRPHKITLLATIVRAIIVLGSTHRWILALCAAYCTYGLSLSQEVVNKYLPHLRHVEASGIAFHAGVKISADDSSHFNVAGKPEFAMVTMTAALFAVLLIVGYAEPPGIPLNATSNLPADMCPVIALLFTSFFGVTSGFVRATFLDSQNMLLGHASSTYLVLKWINLPKMLLSCAYMCLVTTGLLLWGELDAPAAAATLCLGPIGIYCGLRACIAWIRNECQIVNWPPSRATHPTHQFGIYEVDLAFNMLESMMGDADTSVTSGFETPLLVRKSQDEGEKLDMTIELPMLPPSSIMKQDWAPVESCGLKSQTMRRRQMIDLGLHSCRVNKHRHLVTCRSSKKESNGSHFRRHRDEPLPDLTVREICGHLAGLFAGRCISYLHQDSTKTVDVTSTKLAQSGSHITNNSESNLDPAWLCVPLWEAVVTGSLLREEYATLICAVATPFLVMTLGGILALYLECAIGHSLWILTISMGCSTYPIIKWFKTCKITRDMKYALVVGCVFYFGLLAWTFYAWLDARVDVARTLWTLDAAILYPISLGLLCRLVHWIDRSYRNIETALADMAKSAHPPPGLNLTQQLLRSILHLFFLAQIYLWISRHAALLCVIVLFGAWSAWWFASTWAANDFYVPPELVHRSRLMVVYGCIIAIMAFFVLRGVPAAIALSIFFVLSSFKRIAAALDMISYLEVDAAFWFSPSLLPVYSYSPQLRLLLDETPLFVNCAEIIGIGICWGAALVCFVQPISVGIGIMCIFISSSIILVVAACTHIPLKLGIVARNLPTAIFVDAAVATRKDFLNDLNTGSSYEARCDEWENDGSKEQQETGAIAGDLSACALAIKIDAAKKSLRVFAPKHLPLARRADALYVNLDGIAEACASRGPFGCLGLFAGCVHLAPLCLKFWSFDQEGERLYTQDIAEAGLCLPIRHVRELSDSFQHRFEQERRALSRFHLFVLTATEAHLKREENCLCNFLIEKRFKLISTGILVPSQVAQEVPSAIVNVQFLVSWLASLGDDQLERFYLLHQNFKADEADYNIKVRYHNLNESAAATELAFRRLKREREMYAMSSRQSHLRRSKRTRTWIATLSSEEHDRFNNVLQRQWDASSPCAISPRDQTMRKSYEVHVLLNNNETVGNCRERLAELEAGEFDCFPSTTRTGALQFVDSEFPAGLDALGLCSGASVVNAWKHALSVRPQAAVFGHFNDPDDVHPGACVDDSWFLAALSVLFAAGGVNSRVTHQIKQLFINMVDSEGNLVYDSAVGAFGLQLYVNGQWEAIIVDDSFPMLGDGTSQGSIDALIALDAHRNYSSCIINSNNAVNSNNEPRHPGGDSTLFGVYKERYRDCAGFAISHVVEMSELWVSLLEKGVAKYYGSYAAIEAGFVHQGLELLTGHKSECLYIAEASDGIRKHALWGSLLRYHKNEYILGADAVRAEFASSLLQGSGLLFGATYTIYDIVCVMPEGLKLIKLRNPAGHTNLYRGAWCRSSPRWTKRLRCKLLQDLEPQTFWISFDEFCRAFRSLYVCHYYTEESTRWKRRSISGEWTCDNHGHESTAAGLPSRHNPGCEVERNPQFAIFVHRPTTLRFSIRQTDENGRANACVLPIAGYLCRACWHQHGNTKHIDRITKLSNINIIKTTGASRRDHAVDAYVDRLDPGAYVVLVATFQAQMQGNFTLALTFDHEIEVRQIWPPLWRGELSNELSNGRAP